MILTLRAEYTFSTMGSYGVDLRSPPVGHKTIWSVHQKSINLHLEKYNSSKTSMPLHESFRNYAEHSSQAAVLCAKFWKDLCTATGIGKWDFSSFGIKKDLEGLAMSLWDPGSHWDSPSNSVNLVKYFCIILFLFTKCPVPSWLKIFTAHQLTNVVSHEIWHDFVVLCFIVITL